MAQISIQNGIISSSANFGLYHGSSAVSTITSDGIQFTGSVSLQSSDTSDFFLLKSGSFDSLTINGQGVLTLGGFSFDPDAVAGGFYYSNSDNEFYLGKS